MIDLMTNANFGFVLLGIETPDEESLRNTRKFQNLKSSLVESVANICKNGLSVLGSFVIGFDGEQPGADKRIIDFVNQTKMPMVVINTLEVAPGTALWKRLESENRLTGEQTDAELASGWYGFIPSRPAEQIEQEVLNARQQLYDPAQYMKRCYEYYLAMRPTRKALGIETSTPTLEARSDKMRFRLNHLKPLFGLVWRRGIVSRHRRQFWTQLAGILRRNPSRVSTYLNALGYGESLYPLAHHD